MEPEKPVMATPVAPLPEGGVPPPAYADEGGTLRSLHPNVLSVWRISAGIAAGVFAVISAIMVVFAIRVTTPMYIMAAINGILALLCVWSAVQYSAWRYRAWRYAVRPHDVVATFGVFWRTRRCVPRLRIPHVDIASGPIDRAFGMANVSLFTAGNVAAVITIPGVTPEEAERLRATLLNLEPSDERRPAPPASGQHAD